jgi:hypothetical protein
VPPLRYKSIVISGFHIVHCRRHNCSLPSSIQPKHPISLVPTIPIPCDSVSPYPSGQDWDPVYQARCLCCISLTRWKLSLVLHQYVFESWIMGAISSIPQAAKLGKIIYWCGAAAAFHRYSMSFLLPVDMPLLRNWNFSV